MWKVYVLEHDNGVVLQEHDRKNKYNESMHRLLNAFSARFGPLSTYGLLKVYNVNIDCDVNSGRQ